MTELEQEKSKICDISRRNYSPLEVSVDEELDFDENELTEIEDLTAHLDKARPWLIIGCG